MRVASQSMPFSRIYMALLRIYMGCTGHFCRYVGLIYKHVELFWNEDLSQECGPTIYASFPDIQRTLLRISTALLWICRALLNEDLSHECGIAIYAEHCGAAKTPLVDFGCFAGVQAVWRIYWLFCGKTWLFCGHTGLFCGHTGLFCTCIGLFCAYMGILIRRDL